MDEELTKQAALELSLQPLPHLVLCSILLS